MRNFLILSVSVVSSFLISAQRVHAEDIRGYASGGAHVCAYGTTSVSCFGSNEYGQAPALVQGYQKIQTVVSSERRTCVLDEHELYCFGDYASVPPLVEPKLVTTGDFGTCAVDAIGLQCWSESTVFPVPTGFQDIRLLASGDGYACAVDTHGLTCWNHTGNKLPHNIKLTGITQVASGFRFVCALGNEGVQCHSWGHPSVTEIPKELGQVKGISAGYGHACATTGEGVICWGEKDYGSRNERIESPIVTEAPKNLSAIDTLLGLRSAQCAVHNNEVTCWGQHFGSPFVPKRPIGRSVSQLQSNGFNTCSISDHGINCWGVNMWGNLNLPKLANPTLWALGGNFTCALDEGEVKCWGDNSRGQLNVPVGLKNVRQMVAGLSQVCVLDDEGLKCWGGPPSGTSKIPSDVNIKEVTQFALGHSGSSDYTLVYDGESLRCWGRGPCNFPSGIKNLRHLAAGGDFACAVDESGLKCWGDNSNGQLDIPANLKNTRALSLGAQFGCVIDDGGVHCWGASDAGQTYVPLLKNPKLISTGHGQSCAGDDDGVKCWGKNNYGESNVPKPFWD